MKSIKLLAMTLCLGFIISCSKDAETEGYTQPITVLSPATNPASTIKGVPISYKAVITNDEYVDSIMVFSQMDSITNTYIESRDTLINKVVYPVGAKKNIQTIESVYMPLSFPPVGKKIFLTFWAKSKMRLHKKTVSIEVR
jgi:hypothetical protein